MEYISPKDLFAINFIQIWFVSCDSFESVLVFQNCVCTVIQRYSENTQKTSQLTLQQERPQARHHNLDKIYKQQTLRNNKEPSVLITKKIHAVKQMVASNFLYFYIIGTAPMNNQGNLQPGLFVTSQVFF